MKYDVFISYSRKDTAIADQICAAFDKAGISYFIDRQGIGGGAEFLKVLAPAIKESEVFLLLASKNAYESAYTDREITFAFNKKRGEKMLPYIIDDTTLPEHLELLFSSNNWRTHKLHPIETILIDDVLQLLGRTKQHSFSKSLFSEQENNNNLIWRTTRASFSEEVTETELLAKYEYVEEFSEGLAAVGKDGKWGFIDQKGNIVIPFQYEHANSFSESLAPVEKNSMFGFITKQGNIVIPLEYSYAYPFSDGLASVRKNGKWGFIDKKGSIAIPFEYDYANSFSDGLASVAKYGRYGFIDKHGSIIIPYIYYGCHPFSDGLACVTKSENGQSGFIDKNGNIAIPFEYDYANSFSEGLASVVKHGKCGFINKNGEVCIPFEYDDAFSFIKGKAKVIKRTPWGESQLFYIDKQGNRID